MSRSIDGGVKLIQSESALESTIQTFNGDFIRL